MKKIVLIIAIIVSCGYASAQPINLEQYRQKVLDYSQQVKKAKEGVMSATSQIEVAKKGFLPKLDAAVEFNYMVHKINIDFGPMALAIKPYTYGVTATAAQNVYAGGAVRKQVEALKIGKDIADYSETLTVDNIIYAAEVSYWQASAMAAFRDAAENYLNIVKETYQIIDKRFEDGLIARTDVLMVDTRIKEAEYQLSSTEKSYKQALINLNILMGVSPDATIVMADSVMTNLPIMPKEMQLEEALDNRAEYHIASNTIKVNEQKMKITKSAYLPKLAVGFTGQYASQMINIDGKGLGNGIAFAQLKVPIFAWNEKKHKVAVDRSAVRSSEYDLQSTIDNVSQELSTSWSNLTQSYSQLSIAKGSMDIAQESLNLNTYSYNEGLLTILDVLSAQLSWLGAYNNVITSNMNYRVALSDYTKATGSAQR